MTTKELERIFKVFGNRRRIAIVLYLQRRKEATVGDVAEHINLSFKATSKHLIILANAGIVESEQRSLQMFYKISKNLPREVRTIFSIL